MKFLAIFALVFAVGCFGPSEERIVLDFAQGEDGCDLVGAVVELPDSTYYTDVSCETIEELAAFLSLIGAPVEFRVLGQASTFGDIKALY